MTTMSYGASLLDDSRDKVPMRITNSFPPRGIVAKILSNSQHSKGGSLYLNGSFNKHSVPKVAQKKKRKEEDSTFSLPQTLTEKTFKTRKTPRFYTVDQSSLRQQSDSVDHALNQLITNADLTDLQEIYQRICKGSVTTLETIVSKKKISRNFVFVQNSSPLTRYHRKTRRLPVAKEQEPQQNTHDQQCGNRENMTSHEKTDKHVLVPSPYFKRKHNEKTSLSSDTSSQHILYSSKFYRKCTGNNTSKLPIEPTVINLTDRLPELAKRGTLNPKYSAKNTSPKQRWGSSVLKSPEPGERSTTGHISTPISQRRHKRHARGKDSPS